jgi:2'-5' RNA ligase
MVEQENLLRIFVAVEMPPRVKEVFKKIRKELETSGILDGTYTNPDIAHMTLQFIGYVEPITLPKIRELLSKISFEPIKATLGKVVLIERRVPKLIWLGIIGEGIVDLVKQIKNVLGIPEEGRVFAPHVTIVRVKETKDPRVLREFVKTIEVPQVSFTIDEFVLKQSVLTREGPIYCEIEKYCGAP